MQRIFVFLTTVGWATNGHHIQDFWSARADQVVRKSLQNLVWQKFGEKHQSVGHIINCWKQTMMYIGEKLQNGETLAEAWLKGNWESKWAFNHHTAYSLVTGGGDNSDPSKSGKKGKKRALNEGDEEGGSDRGWQSKYDSMRIQNAKLQKLLNGKGKGKGKNKMNPWHGGGFGGGWGGGYGGPWQSAWQTNPWKGGGTSQSWPPLATDKGKGKTKGKK